MLVWTVMPATAQRGWTWCVNSAAEDGSLAVSFGSGHALTQKRARKAVQRVLSAAERLLKRVEPATTRGTLLL